MHALSLCLFRSPWYALMWCLLFRPFNWCGCLVVAASTYQCTGHRERVPQGAAVGIDLLAVWSQFWQLLLPRCSMSGHIQLVCFWDVGCRTSLPTYRFVYSKWSSNFVICDFMEMHLIWSFLWALWLHRAVALPNKGMPTFMVANSIPSVMGRLTLQSRICFPWREIQAKSLWFGSAVAFQIFVWLVTKVYGICRR